MDCCRPCFPVLHYPQGLLKLMSIESVMPCNHLILCRPLLLLPSIFPSIRVFSNESVLPIRWPKYKSFSFSISSSNDYSVLFPTISTWYDTMGPSRAHTHIHTQLKEVKTHTLIICLSTPLIIHWTIHETAFPATSANVNYFNYNTRLYHSTEPTSLPFSFAFFRFTLLSWIINDGWL